MNARLILAPLLGLVVAGGAWGLWPSDGSAPAVGAAHEAGARRTRTSADAEPPDQPGAPAPGMPASAARADALDASREAIMDAIYDQLDALDAEVGLDATQYERLEGVLTEERTRAFAALEGVRSGPRPGEPRADRKAIDETMRASRAQAEAEARAVLDDEEYAAWQRLREPARRR